MKVESNRQNKLYTLIPLEDFKALLGVDDREDKISRFCLVTSTLTIEQYCRRRLLRKKHFERIGFFGDLFLPLNEYPITEVLAVYVNGEILEPDFYEIIPDCGIDEDIPFSLSFSPALRRYRNLEAIKITYTAGYSHNNVPADLASACIELAAWNMNRYRGRRIGMTGNVRGSGRDGEHFELSMPENVRFLLEPYKRKVI
ncbi:MAG: hypothetical protein LBE79_07030 [Tannerella sp.]|jgi:hypothetical protein|nr:hypothetical protein [Tannerella sp.]